MPRDIAPSVQRGLYEMACGFHYLAAPLVDLTARVVYNPIQGRVKIDNAYRHHLFPTTGVCSELSLSADREVRERYPSLHMAHAVVTEPAFFYNPHDTHVCLLLSREPFMTSFGATNSSSDIAQVVAHDPLVFDPSFRLLSRLSDSGYSVNVLMRPSQDEKYDNSVILTAGRSIPVGFDAQGRLVHLGAHFGQGGVRLTVEYQRRCSPPEAHLLDSPSAAKGCGLTERLKMLARRMTQTRAPQSQHSHLPSQARERK